MRREASQLWADGFGGASVRVLQFLIFCAGLGLVVWAVSSQVLVTLPVVIAVIFTCALQPALNWLRRRGLGRVGSTVVTFVGALLFLLGAFFLIGYSIYQQAGTLASKVVEGVTQVQRSLEQVGIHLNEKRLEEFEKSITGNTADLTTRALHGVTTVGEIITGTLLTLVLLFFFLLDGDKMWAWAKRFITPRHRQGADVAADTGVKVLGRYVRGTVIIAGFAAIVDTIAMLVMGAPLAIPLGALIFFGAFVPILGALVTGIAAALVVLVTAGVVPALILVGIVIIVNQIEHHILQPRVMGHTLGIHGVVILISLAIGAHVGGIAGAVVAVPLTALAWSVIDALIVFRGGIFREEVEEAQAQQKSQAVAQQKSQAGAQQEAAISGKAGATAAEAPTAAGGAQDL